MKPMNVTREKEAADYHPSGATYPSMQMDVKPIVMIAVQRYDKKIDQANTPVWYEQCIFATNKNLVSSMH